MFNTNEDFGAAVFKTWSEEQKREEIGRLVAGYRSGLPMGIFCKMAETIAGSRKAARGYLAELMPVEERRTAVAKESGGIAKVARDLLL